MSFIQELKRRNVFRVAVAYVVAAWVITEVSSLILEIYESPDSIMRVIVALLALGLPFAIVFAWAFEVTPEGLKRESEVDRSRSVTHQTAKRLDVLTIGLVVVAILFFSADRFLLDRIQEVRVPETTVGAVSAASDGADATRDVLWATRQLLEIDRLTDLGEFIPAFALASEVVPLLDGGYDKEEFWAGFSLSTDIDSEPAGASVYRQAVSVVDGEWEALGVTPLKTVRFAMDEGYRMRFELSGHRSVTLLHEALIGAEWRGMPAVNPVRLDPVDTLPEEMVRIPGFTFDLVEYGDYFVDRFEITNREYAGFVTSGGYETLEYWTEPFIREGEEVKWKDAVGNFVDRTGRPGPATWSGGVYPSDRGDYPVNGVSWFEAAAFAKYRDKELPTTAHHESVLSFYMENSWIIVPRSNFAGNGPRPVGANRAMTTVGVYDLVGNVREWTWNEMGDDTRGTGGGAWTDASYHAVYLIPKSPWDRDSTNGIRLVRTFDSADKLARLRLPHPPFVPRDFRTEEPVSDDQFDIYRRMYAYDPLPLNAETVAVDTFEHWTRERIAFDLSSGERGAAFLYIPNDSQPPYETVVFWPGSGALEAQSVDDHYTRFFDFVVRSGRAVAQPIFFGTYDRDDSNFSINNYTVWPDVSALGTKSRNQTINWVQELSRTIDYLESREDIESDNLGFSGYSWGGELAPIALAIEDRRLKVAVLNVGGLDIFYEHLPEADTFNFLPRVRVPVLMINGEYDVDYPFDSSQKPMFERLGTDPQHKKLFVTPASHFVPHDIVIRETLNWFDQYLGEAAKQ